MRAKAFVLLSGGIDSTTCLHLAYDEFRGNVEGVSVSYGQRHVKEIDFALKSCNKLGVNHHVLDLASVVPSTMLTDSESEVPNASYADLKGVSPTYVPFRNGLMISALVSYAQGWVNETIKQRTEALNSRGPTAGKEYYGSMGIEKAKELAVKQVCVGIYFGAHAEDARGWAYPDCTPEFNGAMANAIYIGTYHATRLHTPLQWLGKDEIIRLGERLGVNWKNTWSCYRGGDKHCGVCPTCRARRDGFKAAQVIDPTEYEQSA